MDRKKTIAVFGSSRRDENSPFWAEAYELGRVLATAGYTVLSGGYGGSMGAVSRGAAECGGQVIGVTCATFDPAPCNEWLTEEVKAPTPHGSPLDHDRTRGWIRSPAGWHRHAVGDHPRLEPPANARTERQALVLLGADWRAVVDTLRQHTDLGSSIASLATMVDTPQQVLSALSAPPTPLGPPPLG